MSARVPRPHPDTTSRVGPHDHAPSVDDEEVDRRRHGNAASTGADAYARDVALDAREDFGLRLSPEQGAAPKGAAPSWAPRARTVEELRARFQERARGQSREVPGHPVDRLGRRLTDFDLDEQEERQRMPEPIPVGWQSPVMPRSPSALSRHMGSGIMGLALGLAITVPGVLWYKGRIDPMAMVGLSAADLGLAVAAPSTRPAVEERQAVAEVRRTVVTPVEAERAVTPSAAREERLAAVQATPTASAPPPPAAAPREEAAQVPVTVSRPAPVEIVTTIAPPQPPPVKPEVAMLEEARRLIGDGDFVAARRVLDDKLLATTPMARFLLAETYDPNFLAARGIRTVRAEVPRAVELYREALSGGVEAARQRLAGLRP